MQVPIASAYKASFVVDRYRVAGLRRKVGEQHVWETIGTSHDLSDIQESKNEGYTTGSMKYSEAFDWKITAASFPEN